MSSIKTYLSTFGTVLLALLPQVFCPACWPAYTSVFSSLGLGFIDYSPYLLPLMSIFMLIALWGLFHKAAMRKGYRPFMLGCLAASAILLGKFVFQLDSVLYAGVVLFIIASVWNAWPERNAVCSV